MRRFSESATFPTPASTPAEEGDRPILERHISEPGAGTHVVPSDPDGELYAVTLDIKNVLTRLLNQESVKSNSVFRNWTQQRLMDSEKDLRQQRRSSRSGSESSESSSSNPNGGSP